MSSSIGASSLRHIVRHAAQLLLSNNSSLNNPRLGFNIESGCVMNSLLHFFTPQLATQRSMDEDEDDCDFGSKCSDDVGWNKFKELLSSYFPSCDTDYSSSGDACTIPGELLEAVQTQLQERHLQKLPSLIEKVSWLTI